MECANEMCDRELSKNGDKTRVTFEYRFSASKGLQPVTLNEKDIALLELLRKICSPNGIIIEEKPGKIIFRDCNTGRR